MTKKHLNGIIFTLKQSGGDSLINLKEIFPDPWTTKFASKLVSALRGIVPGDFFTDIDVIFSIGGGNGRCVQSVAKEFLSKAIVIICDPKSSGFATEIECKTPWLIESNFEDVENDVFKFLKDRKILVELSHVLQLMSEEDQRKMLKKIKKIVGPGGRVLLVDEVRRSGLDGIYDYILNRFFNRFIGNYNRFGTEHQFKLFLEAEGFLVKAHSGCYYRGSIVFLLEVGGDKE